MKNKNNTTIIIAILALILFFLIIPNTDISGQASKYFKSGKSYTREATIETKQPPARTTVTVTPKRIKAGEYLTYTIIVGKDEKIDKDIRIRGPKPKNNVVGTTRIQANCGTAYCTLKPELTYTANYKSGDWRPGTYEIIIGILKRDGTITSVTDTFLIEE